MLKIILDFLIWLSRRRKNAIAKFCHPFHVYINGEFFIHAFMQPCFARVGFLCGREKPVCWFFLKKSFGTLIWLRIILAIFHWSLTGISHTYIIINVLTSQVYNKKENAKCWLSRLSFAKFPTFLLEKIWNPSERAFSLVHFLVYLLFPKPLLPSGLFQFAKNNISPLFF